MNKWTPLLQSPHPPPFNWAWNKHTCTPLWVLNKQFTKYKNRSVQSIHNQHLCATLKLLPYLFWYQNGELTQLKKAYYNRKPVEWPRKKEGAPKKTISSQRSNLGQLKKEFSAKKKDLQKINPLMLGSFPKQREWVESQKTKRSVKKIFKEFSGFKNYELVWIWDWSATLGKFRKSRVLWSSFQCTFHTPYWFCSRPP